MASVVQLLSDNLYYQSSTNPSRNLRDRGRRQHETPECREQRLHKPGANQTTREGDKKQVISDSKDYKPGENLTARQGEEKQVINDRKDYKSGEIQTIR